MIKVSIGEKFGEAWYFPPPEEVAGADSYQVIISDNYILDGNPAEAGASVLYGDEDPVTCEIYNILGGLSTSTLEIYPLEGDEAPSMVKYELGKDDEIGSEDVLKRIVASVFAIRRQKARAQSG